MQRKDRIILTALQKKRLVTSSELHQKLISRGITVSMRTLRRHIEMCGFSCCKPPKAHQPAQGMRISDAPNRFKVGLLKNGGLLSFRWIEVPFHQYDYKIMTIQWCNSNRNTTSSTKVVFIHEKSIRHMKKCALWRSGKVFSNFYLAILATISLWGLFKFNI